METFLSLAASSEKEKEAFVGRTRQGPANERLHQLCQRRLEKSVSKSWLISLLEV